MLRAYIRHPHAGAITAAVQAIAMLLMAGCVGRPPEMHGQHASFLRRSAPGAAPGAVPTNVGGKSDTSGLGAGVLVSPNSVPAPTPSAGK